MRIPEAAFVRPLRRKGAAAFVAAALVVAMPLAVSAHDPGLSALDVRIQAGAVRVTLSLAPADVGQMQDRSIESLARAAVSLAIDGVPLADSVTASQQGTGADSITLVYNSTRGTRLRLESTVPRRLAIGHRQLLTVHADDGRVVMERMLDARSGAVEIDLGSTRSRGGTAAEFLRLGLGHILGGYDHLLFLVALLLGVRRLRSVVTTVTAFTVAHSVTLSMAVLGLVAVPAAFVEPLIAASIVFVGIENLAREEVGSRWKLTFLFGLVHGFGFAGALRDIGVGVQPGGVVLPLASFNIGVEAGQLAVVLAVWPLLNALNGVLAWKARLAPATSLGVVAAGCYWLVERIIR
jgi:hydrogenase/urease accessory protein HupE